ncbi:DUF6879 family protein [Kitasatospora sp. NBC_01266]|uniref:DUF6879 family protein n=1 Tax=Kitasatospora sp. NBC_01266 TaxID=2903572 RepID=UPI002E32871D|nr:DUF6879 family protein [Kitasatospora sp. NBC_01266]
MRELRRPDLPASVLGLTAYRADFAARDALITDRPSWKLERRQHFLEPGNDSWVAFRRGDWAESLQLMESRRPALSGTAQERERRSNPFLRVRVVEEPLTPYLQWELSYLRVQAQCGRPVRVVHADKLGALEESRPLPEIVVLGSQLLYEVRYSTDGTLEGGVRYLDRELAQEWGNFISELYGDGEDVVAYVDRHVSQLPPPVPGG